MNSNMTYNTHRLKNGLRIIHLPRMGEVVYCGYAIDAGSRDEMDGEEGLAHFCEHTTFKGTDRRSPLQVINSLELVGGELNAFTTKEDTFYYAAILRQHFAKAVDLLTDIVFHSVYPSHELDKEKEVVCDEIDSYRDSPAELIYDEYENIVFSSHPIGHNVLGDKETVRSFTPDHCLRFTRRLYRPERCVFYVSGNVDFRMLVRRLEKAFQDKCDDREGDVFESRRTGDYVFKGMREDLLGARRDNRDQMTHQAHVMTGTAFHGDTEKHRIPLFVLNNILGGPSMNSRLNLSLRERRGLVYTVESSMTAYTDALLWTVYFGCDPHDVNHCITLVKRELHRLAASPLSSRSLNAAKRQLRGQIALSAENAENYAISMAKQYLHKGTLKSIPRLLENVDAVTPEAIHRIASEFLSDERLFTLVVV